MNENELRDELFGKYRENIASLFGKRKSALALPTDTFPRISELLQRRTEARINGMLDNLEQLQLDGKEVRLVRNRDSTTRIDLLGHIGDSGDLAIIELKKSGQTERQAFTELLAYVNHFCTIFPPLTESSLQSVLIAPMEGRGVRDALAQELIINNKNIVAFVPHMKGNTLNLEPYYPSQLYYRWIENSILDDSSMTVVTAAFPLIDGWIDAGEPGRSPPNYTQRAFETMTALIAQELEAQGLHGFVYARQYWSEACLAFANPNTIVLCVVNPFSPHRTSSEEGIVFGASDEERLAGVQAIIDQMEGNEPWLESLHSAFMGQAIRIVQKAFDEFFVSTDGVAVHPEISLPDWGGFKANMVEAAICHNMSIRLSGLLRIIFTEYLGHCFSNGIDEIYFYDDLPRFGYIAHDHFLAVWEILSGLSQADSDDGYEDTQAF